MKHTANIISLSRIILVVALLIVRQNPFWFVLVYLLAGLSDVLDGYVARKTQTQSMLGAQLDSLADLLLFGVVLTVMCLWLREYIPVFLPWIMTVALLRVINLIIAARKYGKFAILHTWGNKLTGLLLFLTPLLFIAFHRTYLLWPVCMIATLSAVEEAIILVSSKELDVNRRSLFVK